MRKGRGGAGGSGDGGACGIGDAVGAGTAAGAVEAEPFFLMARYFDCEASIRMMPAAMEHLTPAMRFSLVTVAGRVKLGLA